MTEELLTNLIKDEDWLSSGSTLVNLAVSGHPNRCFTKGRYFWFCGDSSSGKTFICLLALAEASINKNFDDYDIIFDNVEDGALMDVEKFYGPRMARRLQAPSEDDGEPVFSQTVEDFYFNLDDRLQAVKARKAKPFIYLLDSMDALSSKYEGDKFDEKKKADRKGTKAKGDYGDGKAKLNSTWMRKVVADLRDTGSILIVLSQTRDNIERKTLFDPKTVTAGGHALKFYASCQFWTTLGSKLKREVNGKQRSIGITSNVAVKKNRISGKEWSVKVPIYFSTGVDDTGSCVDFLVEEGFWKKNEKNGRITVSDWDFTGPRGAVIDKVEEEGLEVELRTMVTECWRDLEEDCAVHRKNKYQEE